MKIALLLSVSLLALVVPQFLPTVAPKKTSRSAADTAGTTSEKFPIDRSPTDLALLPNGQILTTNNTANTVSLVNSAAGKVVSEVATGAGPFAVAVTPDGARAFVTNTDADTVTAFAISAGGLKAIKTIPVGDEPHGICLAPNGKTAYVALGGEESIAVLDLTTLTVSRRIPAGLEPYHIALTPDGTRLIVLNTRGRTASIIATATGANDYTVKVLGRNLRHIAVDKAGKWAYFPAISERGQGVTKENIDRGWVVGNRLVRVPLDSPGPREALTLDISRDAVGDVDGIALSPDGKTLALTAGGTHELLLLTVENLPFVSYGGPGDHLEPELAENPKRFRRIKLGGRPLGVTFTPDGKQIVVANYLLNAVQIVDTATGYIAKKIALGGPPQPSLARRGEAIFLDANRSFGSWYSCNSCHVGGHTNGGNFDTLNDGGFGKPKKTLSLRGIAETAPYTWHGWQKSLHGAVGESLRKTMQGPEPTEDDINAVEAYLRTLRYPASPFRAPDRTLTASAKRGEIVFNAKQCQSCHMPPTFTSEQVVSVGLEAPDDVYQGFNPPSLRNVYARAPYLHDGRARTLEEVLTKWHTPAKLSGTPDCTPSELADLVAYLKSL